MRIFWQDTEEIFSKSDEPLSSEFLFKGANKSGWSFFNLSIDEDTGIIIGNDKGNALLYAVKVNEKRSFHRIYVK